MAQSLFCLFPAVWTISPGSIYLHLNKEKYMRPSILIVDDEKEILNSLKRVLRKDYTVHTFTDPSLALSFFVDNPCQIVISDMKMPNIDGAEFLNRIYRINPRCKRVILTGHADAEMAQRAINDAKVSTYLNKPWDNKKLLETLTVLIEDLKNENKKLSVIKKLKVDHEKLTYHNESMSVTANFMEDEHKSLLEQRDNLKTSHNELLHLTANLIAMQTEDSNGHSFRVAKQAKMLALACGLTKKESIQIYFSGLYHRVGITSLDRRLLASPWHQLSQQDKYLWAKFPQASAEILATTTFLSHCGKTLRHLNENIDGTGIPDRLKKDKIPMGSRILAPVIYFDLLISGFFSGDVTSPAKAAEIIKSLTTSIFDEQIVVLFLAQLKNANTERALSLDGLIEGMVLAQDVLDRQQNKLLLEGTQLTNKQINSIKDYQERSDKVVIVYVQ